MGLSVWLSISDLAPTTCHPCAQALGLTATNVAGYRNNLPTIATGSGMQPNNGHWGSVWLIQFWSQSTTWGCCSEELHRDLFRNDIHGAIICDLCNPFDCFHINLKRWSPGSHLFWGVEAYKLLMCFRPFMGAPLLTPLFFGVKQKQLGNLWLMEDILHQLM